MCKLCTERGTPEYFASIPKCAFPNGTYTNDNWQCVTMGELRVAAVIHGYVTRQNDESIGVLKVPDAVGNGYLVMNWYKSRGATGGALILEDDKPPLVLTLEMAEGIIKYYKEIDND